MMPVDIYRMASGVRFQYNGNMSDITDDFVSREPRAFPFKLGSRLASSLTGFVAGALAASIVWLIGVWYVGRIQSVAYNPAANQNPVIPAALPQTATHKVPTR
jgi:hypothetical protein